VLKKPWVKLLDLIRNSMTSPGFQEVKDQRIIRWSLMLGAVLLLAGCSPVGTATSLPPSPSVTNTPEPSATLTATQTATPQPTPSLTASPTVEPTPTYPVLSLETVDPVLRAYPGPVHYEGDLLTLEINAGEYVEVQEGPVLLQVDNQDPFQVTGEWRGNYLLVQLDTTGLTGNHRLTIQAEQEAVQVDETYRFQVQPASQRPAQEEDPAWVSRDIECCVLHYITGTAAARDIDWIAENVQQAADDFDEFPTVDINEKIDIFFIDRMWYNGAFGGAGELLAVYTDRYYGPSQGGEGLQVLVRHELGHAVFPLFSYSEGLSVYLAGGHYKPEPIPERAAAMLERNYYVPSVGPTIQHEIIYLHQAAMINYIINTYGWDALWAYVQADSKQSGTTLEQRDEFMQETLGVSQDEFQRDFVAWLRAQEPGEQVQDLLLTVELQDLRRGYQQQYAPWPQFLLGYSEDSFARPEYLRVNIREPRSPAHIATELLIANAQKALTGGQYEVVQSLIEVIESVVASGRLEHPLAREYAAVVSFLAERGYETVSLDLHGDEAIVQVTQSPPELETMGLHKVDGLWRIDAFSAEPETKPTEGDATPTLTPASPSPIPLTSTATSPPLTPTQIPTGALYYDDFSDPETGWDRRSEPKLSFGYMDGAYRIWIDFPGAAYWFNPEGLYADVVVESQVTLRDGPEINRFGLMCRHDAATGGMVQFLIDGRGRFGILWQQAGESTYLGADGMQSSDMINPAGEANLLRAVCAADTLSFFVNGEELLTTQDTVSSGGGELGFIVYTIGGAGIEVSYDYLLVTEP
jgi:hypothetical protein